MKPSISPPLMQLSALTQLCAPPWLTRLASWEGATHGPPAGLGKQTPEQTFGAGIGSEVVVEAAIFLHDEDEVLDLFEARRRAGGESGLSGARPVTSSAASITGNRARPARRLRFICIS